SKISKKGNSFIRKALYMPALAASRYNKDLKVFYERIIDRKPAKKIGITAVARKLLILIYILWKNDQEYIFEEQINNAVMEVGRY
ncbi:transposase, partial [Olivibacter domesticus]